MNVTPSNNFGVDLDFELHRDGYLRFDANEIGLTPNEVEEFRNFTNQVFESVPDDPYCSNGTRRRWHSTFILLPWASSLFPLDAIPSRDASYPSYAYKQSRRNQPEHGGEIRYFHALPRWLQSNRLLHQLIFFDYSMTRWEGRRHTPLFVNVHCVSLTPLDCEPAYATPNCLHQDGEPYTFVHLCNRDNVNGAENIVALPECAGMQAKDLPAPSRLAEFTLSSFLDSFAVVDKMVSHHVEPARLQTDNTPGSRNTLLIDFTPMISIVD